MALANLKKNDRPDVEQAAESFIQGAQQRVKAHHVTEKQERVFERYTFSLTQATSDEIDRLSFIPRGIRVSRSDIIKAGVEALGQLSDEEITQLIMKLKKVT